MMLWALVLLALAQHAAATCVSPWVAHGPRCYLYVSSSQSNLTWSEARQTCVSSYGAGLVSILNQAEQTDVFKLFTQHQVTDPVWIGISDRQHEGVFSWTDGSGNTSSGIYTNWLAGEPNNARNEDCGAMTAQGLWNDAVCSLQLGYICKRSVSSTLPAPPSVGNFTFETSVECGGADWYSYQGYCYLYNDTLASFAQARATCYGQGATLATILTQAELAYLKAFIVSQNTSSFYIALNDRLSETSFVWDDGTPNGKASSVKNWGQGEPNDNLHSEDCVEFSPTQVWNDIPCTARRAYMCKRKSSPTHTWPAITTPARTTCPTGYSLFSHPSGAKYCYRVAGGSFFQRSSWFQARSSCRASGDGFDLASVHDHLEANFVHSLVLRHTSYFRTSTWLGLNDRANEGGYIWSDKTPTDYVHWTSGQPNNYRGRQDCVAMNRNWHWDDESCNRRLAYICKYTLVPRSPPKGTPTVHNKYCPAGWHQYGAYCYYVKAAANTTHSQANAACHALQANLTSINSNGEQAFIMAHVGLHNASATVHIGINDIQREGEFSWTDGSLVTYTNWGFNQPNNWRRSQDCTELDHRLGLWNDISCSWRTGYVCKKLRNETSKPAVVTAYCPSGWHWFKGQCYITMATAANQSAAEATCVQQRNQHGIGGHLASIGSRYVNFFLSSLITANATSSQAPARAVWFGLNDKTHEGTYGYTSPAPVTYTNWARGQPNNWRGTQDCVEMWSSTSKWNDNNCVTKLPYICSIVDNTVTKLPPPPTPRPAGSPTAPCATGFLKHNTRCYGFFGNINQLTVQINATLAKVPITPRNWIDAVHSCTGMGASLVSIPSQDVQDFLTSSAVSHTRLSWFWTGLNDRSEEGGYVWVDGSPVTYTHWSAQQPNDFNGNQDCVHVILARGNRALANTWNDYECNNVGAYVCEYPAGKKLPLSVNPTWPPPPGMKQISCPPGWVSTSDQCYQVQPLALTNTFTNAERKCQALVTSVSIAGVQPHLASIHSAQDHLVLSQLLANITSDTITQFWIGLQDKSAEGVFNWTDSSTVNYLGWSQGQPNNLRNSQDCVEIRVDTGYLWNDRSCAAIQPYVCGFSRFIASNAGQPTPLPPYHGIICAAGWKKFQRSCYREFTTNHLDYESAFANCTRAGGDLVVISSRQEETFITTHLGLEDTTEYVWIGLSDEELEGSFIWVDGTPLRSYGYANWGRGQPNNRGNEDCVAIHTSDSKWYDRDCTERHSFVCEVSIFKFNITSPTTTPATVPTQTGTKGKQSITTTASPPSVTTAAPGQNASGGTGAPHRNPSSGGLSRTGKIAAVVGASVLVVLVVTAVVFLIRRSRRLSGSGRMMFHRVRTSSPDSDDDDVELIAD